MSTRQPTPPRLVSLGFTPELYPEGTHICYLYSDENERQRFMSAFVSSGIKEGEAVVYLADAAPAMLEQAIKGLCIETPSSPDQLTVTSAEQEYCPHGRFIPQAMVARVHEMYAAHAHNCAGVRMTGEMSWAAHDIPGIERLVEYEGRLNEVAEIDRSTLLCQYDMRKFSGEMIFELLNVHPVMIVHGQIMRNPFYVAPDDGGGRTYGKRKGT